MSILLKSYIKQVLKENKIKITKLHVFDFDSTLYNSEDNSWIDSIVKDAKNSIKDKNTLAILCTARPSNTKMVLKTSDLLYNKGIYFKYKFFKTSNFDKGTPAYKSEVIKTILKKYPDVTELKFWEDRKDTLYKVEDLIDKKFKNINYFPVLVKQS
tara:strand:+ start:338 stop:805 length:468 start_codon:yes stop_codon:yes gene_type:complete